MLRTAHRDASSRRPPRMHAAGAAFVLLLSLTVSCGSMRQWDQKGKELMTEGTATLKAVRTAVESNSTETQELATSLNEAMPVIRSAVSQVDEIGTKVNDLLDDWLPYLGATTILGVLGFGMTAGKSVLRKMRGLTMVRAAEPPAGREPVPTPDPTRGGGLFTRSTGSAELSGGQG